MTPTSRLALPLKHRPLQADVRRLGALLGGVLREQGPPWLYERVEGARRAAIRRRDGDGRAESELWHTMSATEPAEAIEIARAFSAWFELVNLAERVHRLRRRAAYEASGAPQPGGLSAVLESLRARGATAEEIGERLAAITLEPVVTAHPTEAVRRTLLAKELRMARALLARREDVKAPNREHTRALRQVGEELIASWQTEEHRAERPTVADEREHALFYLTTSLWQAVPKLYRALEEALGETFGADAERLALGPNVRCGSWIGGDMDGNPSVCADTFRESLARHSGLALDLYGNEIRELFRHLSQSRSRVGVSAEVDERILRYSRSMPHAARTIPKRYSEMPYRILLWLMSARLDATRTAEPNAYASPQELIEDLDAIAASLRENRGEYAGRSRVVDLARSVRCFGFHLATLDARQDAWVLRRTVGELLADPEFADRSPAERARRMASALDGNVAVPESLGEEAAKNVEVMRAMDEARGRYGHDAVGLYVISMAQGPDDALAVLLIASAAGASQGPLDIAPLFETVDDLETAPATMRTLLADPTYRAHLASRGNAQWVMLGYSDSSKTSGLIASRVALQRAQLQLIRVAKEARVDLRFFHGRGGSASRGGTKPRQAVLAAPRGTLGGHLRVTEQGEIIRAKYGLEGIAERTLELLLGATLERVHLDGEQQEEVVDERLVELARTGRAAYRDLLERDPDFLPYFRSATPIDVIERLGLGSRPSRRREMRGVEDLRAIPWVFSWTQCRLLLPGWYGTGTALDSAAKAHGLAALRDLVRESAFFRTMLTDVEMVLAKAELGIAQRYSALAGRTGERVFARLADEYELTCALVCDVLEVGELLERDPLLQRAIQLRNPYIDPMSFLQVDLLARWRASGSPEGELLKALFTTVHGIARGMQNTG